VVVAKVLESKDQNYGYNAQTSVFEDLVKARDWTRPRLRGRRCRMPLDCWSSAHHRSPWLSSFRSPSLLRPAANGGGGMDGMY